MTATTYAVVDIETTGTDPKTDRIIQFGCVLVRNGEIISRFATDINPNQMISKQIQSLTGITNGRVQKAPYFEDVAATIRNLLADTVFVAHNIYFDYKFLSHELLRCGEKSLTIPGIDTVELAQIFLPTEPSFRLGDLANSLGLLHKNPHQADSDAEVTAELLLTIQSKMESLPLITLEKIAELSSLTGMETSHFISKILADMRKHPQPLASELKIIEGIAIQKKEVMLFSENYYQKKEYPKSTKAKQKMLRPILEVRKEQNQLMNLTYRHFVNDKEKNLVIEAATGMGKTIGYLLPLNFLATPENPAIISTASILLQHQIFNKDIPLLNTFLKQPIQATIVKSPRHYLDLQRFKATLEEAVTQKQYALYQMAVLVWLTETVTGDFEELQMTNRTHPFWEMVSHRGERFLSDKQPFFQDDFWIHLRRKMQQSNFLIINHAYLAQETVRKEFRLPPSDYLLIDEAHHLADYLEKSSRQTFSSIAFSRKIQQLSAVHFFEKVRDLLKDKLDILQRFQLWETAQEDLLEEQGDFYLELLKLFPSSKNGIAEEQVVEKKLFDQLSEFGVAKLEQVIQLLNDLSLLQEEIAASLMLNLDNWSSHEQRVYGELFNFFEEIGTYRKIFVEWTQNWQPEFVHWLTAHKNKEGVSLFLLNYRSALLEETNWYERYRKILYLGGTIKVGQDRHYFPKRWGIPNAKVRLLKNPYNFQQQARIFVPKEGIDVHQVEPSVLVESISEMLLKLAEQGQRRILVLFTSHDLLQQVYYKVHQEFLDKGREIFAQGLSGSREKIIKRFFLSKDGILLGADSFWEGIDLPGDSLQLLIITRLPFENPKRPLVKARYRYLEAQGVNAFYQEAVPKAALKLRQALGRLIRSQYDQGVLIVLDRRLITASYSSQLIKAFPEDLMIRETCLENITEETQQFLIKKPKEMDNQGD